ncbi:MAG: M48 family metalloprotease, partial [Alphaproteobacteria bacterium]|nr:M48 family metalloprotease [Alphaproteobacteria bacterium]
GNPSLGMGVLAGSAGMTTQSMLAFSRDEERMADNLGLDLMVRAGQNPNGFVDVFEQMRDITGAAEEKINPNRINHPLTTERLKNVREYIASRPSDYKSDVLRDARRRAEYELVRAKLVGYLHPGDRVRTLYPNADKSDAALYARAIANMRAGNLAAAKTGTQTLISRHADNPYFYELLGDIEYQYGHYDDSVAAYDKSLELAGNAPQIQTALALVLSERNKPGDRDRAVELCRRALLVEPASLTYWVLARAWGNDDGRADWAMAEYYNMTGDKKKTRQYATRAQRRLPKSAPEYIKSGDLLK